jgi:hypothetical protein
MSTIPPHPVKPAAPLSIPFVRLNGSVYLIATVAAANPLRMHPTAVSP